MALCLSKLVKGKMYWVEHKLYVGPAKFITQYGLKDCEMASFYTPVWYNNFGEPAFSNIGKQTRKLYILKRHVPSCVREVG